jgi:hypothetical protein
MVVGFEPPVSGDVVVVDDLDEASQPVATSSPALGDVRAVVGGGGARARRARYLDIDQRDGDTLRRGW